MPLDDWHEVAAEVHRNEGAAEAARLKALSDDQWMLELEVAWGIGWDSFGG